jgi:uncharacterized protein (DUF2126 family)/transglutaminase-like putative cysteine protease
MSITVSLHHKTTYGYDRPVRLGPHVVRLRPAPHCRTPILAYSLKVQPQENFLNWQQDPFGNYQAHIVFPRETDRLELEIDLVAELTAHNPFDFFIDDHAQIYPFAYDEQQQIALSPYLELVPAGRPMQALLADVRARFCRPDRRTLDVLVDVNRAIKDRLEYGLRMEPGVFSPDETLERGGGSCRDFAWLLTQLCRRMGMAARFVSGYSIQLKADIAALDGPQGVTQDVTDLHAWAEVFLPGAGWIGFDATSGLMCAEGHLPLACTADPGSAAPVTGGYVAAGGGGAEHDPKKNTFSFAMRVERTREQPRVTKPYTDEAWRAIDSLGQRVDGALAAADVRLSMGGEPTFVSIDDPDGAEWNTAALGAAKRRLSGELFDRLYARFAPGGLPHHGQGKWYPGEPLPRWALTCYFRKDGVALWRRPELIAREGGEPVTLDTARALVRTLAQRLGVDGGQMIPAYEDGFHYAWRERRLPVNVSASDARLDDPIERARLARVFEQGLTAVAGYVLPLDHADVPGGGHKWRTGPWPLRAERLCLLPGDSALGYRLPLDSLPWVAPADRPVIHPVDPFAPVGPLPTRPREEEDRSGERPVEARRPIAVGPAPTASSAAAAASSAAASSAPRATTTPNTGVTIRTALCAEIRDGILHLFMPPLTTAEAYIDLVDAIEDAAQSVGCAVRLEGYPPPRDPRVGQFAVTPDPGVIEVNIQPALSWNDLVANTLAVYDDARLTRLGTEKFLIDGRHTGTGGGNHLVLGGPTPADSPLLRRPDLLRSLIAYFLNHPALSYFFSGLFVGPTSQAPRIDEARQESVDEIEIAFSQIDAMPGGVPLPPWIVDRVFRNLLTDITGNTHRAELCIDKLFSPDSASGRQGLLELRSFEMPPHPRMSLVQQLLLRALVATFWQTPYRRPPTRWGTALHDRFMLPHFIAQDLDDVLAELRQSGFAFKTEWFIPHFEFRFPACGQIAAAGIVLELRQAIEPWSVMGEESAGGGQARFVDSSLERLQVKVQGLAGDRYVVACNRRLVPLHPTGVSGEMVAGVRFRAWQLYNALHPRIGVHAPLTFDLIDTWSGRAIGGCTYHVSHPGGFAFDQRPRNALEAEGRRQSRFFAFGHSPGPLPETIWQEPPRPARGFPFTLDLRR